MEFADRSVAQLTEATQDFVGSAETVEVALNGFGRHPMLSAGFLGFFFGNPRILTATDKSIKLLDVDAGTSWGKVRPKSALGSYPRDTKLGPPKGVSHKIVLPDGQKIYLHRILFDHVRRIDGEAVGG
jgi:hypothetical protein